MMVMKSSDIRKVLHEGSRSTKHTRSSSHADEVNERLRDRNDRHLARLNRIFANADPLAFTERESAASRKIALAELQRNRAAPPMYSSSYKRIIKPDADGLNSVSLERQCAVSVSFIDVESGEEVGTYDTTASFELEIDVETDELVPPAALQVSISDEQAPKGYELSSGASLEAPIDTTLDGFEASLDVIVQQSADVYSAGDGSERNGAQAITQAVTRTTRFMYEDAVRYESTDSVTFTGTNAGGVDTWAEDTLVFEPIESSPVADLMVKEPSERVEVSPTSSDFTVEVELVPRLSREYTSRDVTVRTTLQAGQATFVQDPYTLSVNFMNATDLLTGEEISRNDDMAVTNAVRAHLSEVSPELTLEHVEFDESNNEAHVVTAVRTQPSTLSTRASINDRDLHSADVNLSAYTSFVPGFIAAYERNDFSQPSALELRDFKELSNRVTARLVDKLNQYRGNAPFEPMFISDSTQLAAYEWAFSARERMSKSRSRELKTFLDESGSNYVHEAFIMNREYDFYPSADAVYERIDLMVKDAVKRGKETSFLNPEATKLAAALLVTRVDRDGESFSASLSVVLAK